MKGGVVLEIVHETNVGFIYDVCQVIICKTSKRESWINSYVLNGREEKDIEIMDENLRHFSSIDRCWKMISILHPKKGRLITKLFAEFTKETVFDFDKTNFMEYITNPDILRPTVSDWYFEREDFSDRECFNQLQNMQDLDDEIRINLYEFFTAQDEYISRMRTSLQMLFDEMTAFFDIHHDLLTSRQNNFEYSQIKYEEKLFSNTSVWNQNIKESIVSFSLINRYIILRDEFLNKRSGWILLGVDYDIEVEAIVNSVRLNEFGHALSDTTRLNILKEIHLNGEKTLTDLSNKFNLVNAVMLYHLDILRNVRLLVQRHEGRRVYYWLNYSRLKQAIYKLNSEFGGDLIETMEEALSGSDEQRVSK